MPLTDKTIKHALPAECPRKLFDGGGLHLLITPQCGKYWCYCYRFAGKNCTLALGGYNKISDYAIQTGRATHNRAAAVPKIVHSADKRRGKHHSALPVAEMGIFLRCLEEYTNRKTALLPRLLILTLTCSGEVRTKPPKPSE